MLRNLCVVTKMGSRSSSSYTNYRVVIATADTGLGGEARMVGVAGGGVGFWPDTKSGGGGGVGGWGVLSVSGPIRRAGGGGGGGGSMIAYRARDIVQ